MREYVKPVVLANDELSEGVYAASGSDCYTVNANMHQHPEQGRGDYRIQMNGVHAASDNHHGGAQVLTVTFNQPVTYKGSNGTIISGDGTNTICIQYNYHNNGMDNIGLGDVIVEGEPGLAVTGAVLSCDHDCGQH